MHGENFENLDPILQISLIVAMYIRNEMEDFHSQHLSDTQMKELNPIIRQAIYDIMRYIKLASSLDNNSKKVFAEQVINFQIGCIPDYWELPAEQLEIQLPNSMD